MRSFTIPAATCILLVGCATTADLKVGSSLTESDRQMAQTIAERTAQSCITYRSNDSGTQKTGDMKLTQLPEVRRLYRSSADWYKAETVASGIWDNVYYNSRNHALVCGEKNWQQYGNSGEIRFIDVGAKQRLLP